ncbi:MULTISPECIES: DUF4062 domain-containing protein [Clostridium]|uniref:DUF4062 domain-containing protein n=1 Tax=Clostridium TaxID=1485 RepID=UPI0006BF84C0|nr:MULTISPECIES: DUF4062 domain-containing protein [Clostridium]MDU7212999.1 DUF4062 domain-containing protein [Clostridium sp.]CUN78879.1 Uncharacterised protein [Clostridium paraputrificum]
MEKRYQIFISSTFADLEEERKEVMEAIINLNCFPAGMEMFPATDIEQFEYIKTIIEQSDYYVLVIAGRYGSVAEDGKSYTEKEYEYAREKGIPVLVFVKRDIENISASKIDNDPKLKEKLIKFRDSAMKNRLAKFWDEKSELKYQVYDSLSKSIKMIPRDGWIKGDTPTNSETLIELEKLRKEKNELEERIKYLDSKLEEKDEIKDIAQGNDKITINYIYDYYEFDLDNEKGAVSITWNELFRVIAPEFEIPKTVAIAKDIIDESINRLINQSYDSIEIDKDDFNVIKYQFDALGLIEHVIGQRSEGMALTDKGRRVLKDMIIMRKELE